MFGFLLALLVIDGLLLTVVVLLQAGKGGGLAAMGGGSAGTDTLIGGRQAATLLTKTSWVAGGLFLALALVLAVLSSRATQPDSVLRGLRPDAPAAAPQPVQIPGTQPQGEGTRTAPSSETPAAPQGTTPAPTTTGG